MRAFLPGFIQHGVGLLWRRVTIWEFTPCRPSCDIKHQQTHLQPSTVIYNYYPHEMHEYGLYYRKYQVNLDYFHSGDGNTLAILRMRTTKIFISRPARNILLLPKLIQFNSIQ